MSLQSRFVCAVSVALWGVLVLGLWVADSQNRSVYLTGLQRQAERLFLAFPLHPRAQAAGVSPVGDVVADVRQVLPAPLFGATYRRVVRNARAASYKATRLEMALMQRFDANPSLSLIQGIRRQEGKEVYTMARPWIVQERCFTCHVREEGTSAPPPVDVALGRSGQWIGAAVLTIPVEALSWWATKGKPFWLPFFFFVLSVPLLTLTLFRVMVERRLVDSGQLMLEIAKDPHEKRRFFVSGKDEIGRMEEAFNQVVDAFQEAQWALRERIRQLIEKEDRFRSLADSASDGFISADSHQTILSWNQGASKIFGYSEEEMVGQSFLHLIPSRLLKSHRRGFQRVLSEGGRGMDRKPKEAMGVHKSGREIPIEISLSSWVTGGQHHFSAIIRDTSERVLAKEKSQRELLSRIALNTILEIGLQSYPLQEKLGKVLQVTLAVHWLSIQYRGCIFLMNEKKGHLEMAVHHGLEEPILQACQTLPLGHCLCGQAAKSREIVHAQGVDQYHEITFPGMQPHGHFCVPILNDQRLLGVLNLYLEPGQSGGDEEKRFLKTVAHTLASIIDREYTVRRVHQLSQATEESPASVVITNTRGIIEYVNKKCCSVTGYQKEELVGHTPRILKGGDLPHAVYADLWQTISGGKEWRGELHNRRKNGEYFWEDVAISPIRNRNGETTHYLAVKEDITQRKELEDALGTLLSTLDQRVAQRTMELDAKVEELERTRNKLIDSEKMASLGRLVAGFAHEINTPIGISVAGSSQIEEAIMALEKLLEADEVEEEKIFHIMDIIREASVLTLSNLRRAGALIASFKRTSVDQSSEEMRLFNVLETSQDVVRSLHNRLKKTAIKVTLKCPQLFQVLGLPGILDQLLTNLIMNSIIHGFEEGTKAGDIVVEIAKREGRLELLYSDTGVGMADAVREKIFEPFFTTHRAHGGSGLGLYLCYNLVTSKLNGTIRCESAVGQGVRFHISFPIEDCME